MDSTELQQAFFNTVKNCIPPHVSMVDQLADLLNLSYDSVYRRIRGEKPLTMNELKKLCDHYHVSVDQVLQLQTDSIVFHAPDINNGTVSIEEYLTGVLKQFKYFNTFSTKQMLYLCKDLPMWHFYSYPEIASFKTFCWVKTILNNPEYQNKKFSLADFPFNECYHLGQQILIQYNLLPSVELWNFESFTSSIKQVEYYRDAGLFSNKEDFDIVLNSFDKTLEHIQHQAEAGRKFIPGAAESSFKEPYQLYVNEVVLGNNTIMVELDGNHHCFINYNFLNYLMTKDLRFTSRSNKIFHNLLSRSTIISGTGEKYRNKFFSHLHEKIASLR
ncbi:MAG TPA: helix-turn-helix domain-containing protein [Chitinophagaceae bacterium]|jgi:hypothetical protein|nr:helix-turn-helix domain-containing protein [Chitinophagaceae bacterium]